MTMKETIKSVEIEKASEIFSMIRFYAQMYTDSTQKSIEKYNKSMEEDYEDFFRWHAGEAFVAHFKLGVFKELQGEINDGCLNSVIDYIERKVKDFENTLLNTSLHMGSTSELHNVAYELELSAIQDIRKEYVLLLRIIKDASNK